jgi:ABC-type nickel/cobalt efflux system permease component RcnA
LSLRERRCPVLPHALAAAILCLATLAPSRQSQGHDIPNQRVDRSIQATIHPGRMEIDYEVSLTELTLTQDLRALVGSLPGGDRSDWLNRYGEVTGPLNAKGFLITADGSPVLLSVQRFDLVVEEHPRYTFHLEAPLPPSGRLVVHDTNYASSEGTSRLAVRAREGVEIEGDDLPAEVNDIPIRPVWQLGDEEERRTKKVEITFRGPRAAPDPGAPELIEAAAVSERPSATLEEAPIDRLAGLLDRRTGLSMVALIVIAAGLGALHAIQPGHGKTLVSAIALGPEARWYQPPLLGLVTTLAHTGSVLVFAAVLWFTGASQVAGLHRGLAQSAGFAIAAGGLWRIGRCLGPGYDHRDTGDAPLERLSLGGLVGLGLAGGLVPCWDAVGLVVLSAALGRLETGVILVFAFALGMAAVLVAVGLIAARVRMAMPLSSRSPARENRLCLASGVVLALIGLRFFLT